MALKKGQVVAAQHKNGFVLSIPWVPYFFSSSLS
jgi:hypothetical protein